MTMKGTVQIPKRVNDMLVGKAEVKGRMLVRDKDGHPKFDSAEKVREFLNDLSEQDILFLEEKFNDDFHNNRGS